MCDVMAKSRVRASPRASALFSLSLTHSPTHPLTHSRSLPLSPTLSHSNPPPNRHLAHLTLTCDCMKPDERRSVDHDSGEVDVDNDDESGDLIGNEWRRRQYPTPPPHPTHSTFLYSAKIRRQNHATIDTHGGTRTHNLLLRRQTPYPLGHAGATRRTSTHWSPPPPSWRSVTLLPMAIPRPSPHLLHHRPAPVELGMWPLAQRHSCLSAYLAAVEEERCHGGGWRGGEREEERGSVV
nr:hypothetical protein HmN_000213400 [Hymenolepis microstoma]